MVHKNNLAARTAEADRLAGLSSSRGVAYLHVIVDEGGGVVQAKEKALAEHMGRHPEDAGRSVEDFKWWVHEIVDPMPYPIGGTQ
jgi:hypothetical protein